MKRLLASLLIFVSVMLVILIGVSNITEPRIPRNYISGLSEKFYAYPGLNPQPDIVFVGSSRVYRGVWPEYVESKLNTNKQQSLRVYNFGVGGMTAPMMAKVIDFIDNTSTRPQIVFIEPQMVMGAAFDTKVSDRSIFENQFSTFFLGILQIFTQSDGGVLSTFRLLKDYLLSFGRTGLGISGVRNLMLHDDIYSLMDLKSYPMQHAGVFPLDEEYEQAENKRKQKLVQRKNQNSGDKGEAKIDKDVRRLRRVMRQVIQPITRMERWYVESLLNRANSAHVKTGFVFMPMRNPTYVMRQRVISQYVKNHYPEVPLLGINFLQMPQIYKADLWFDRGHLNAKGAKIYSQELGRQIDLLLTKDTLN
ncbi:MAG: hypothetical protein K9K40_09920 [Desulfotignum sp.]|nr:hypothetical protein [Desulfotignum sp.]